MEFNYEWNTNLYVCFNKITPPPPSHTHNHNNTRNEIRMKRTKTPATTATITPRIKKCRKSLLWLPFFVALLEGDCFALLARTHIFICHNHQHIISGKPILNTIELAFIPSSLHVNENKYTNLHFYLLFSLRLILFLFISHFISFFPINSGFSNSLLAL